MKIIAPVNNLQEIEQLAHAGADEFYCGVIDKDWRKKNVFSPNHRANIDASLKDFCELRQVAERAHALGRKVSFCLNNRYMPEMKIHALKAIEANVDGIIAGDIATVLMLNELGVQKQILASTVLNTLNSLDLHFLREFGISRVILPRDLSIREIIDLVKVNQNFTFEVFIMNAGCLYVDGICSFLHPSRRKTIFVKKLNSQSLSFKEILNNKIRRFRTKFSGTPTDGGCKLEYRMFEINGNGKDQRTDYVLRMESFFNLYRLSHVNTCGACAMTDFVELPQIAGYKIVGRSFPLQKKLKDVEFIKEARGIACNAKEEGQNRYKEIRNIYNKIYGYSCNNYCYYAIME